MKKKFAYILIINCLMIFVMWGCELDNYKEPNAGIKGKIIDDISNKPLQTVQPNGFRIKLIEINPKYKNPVPIFFWGKADGTYKSTKLFADKYKVIPVEGAFFEPDTALVNIRGIKTVNFTVTPYLELTNVSVTPISKGAIIKYQIKKPQKSKKILRSESLASQYPSVGHTIFDKVISHDLSNTSDNKIVKTQYSDTLRGLTSGKIYYVRAAAKTQNGNDKYNYSQVFKITVK